MKTIVFSSLSESKLLLFFNNMAWVQLIQVDSCSMKPH